MQSYQIAGKKLDPTGARGYQPPPNVMQLGFNSPPNTCAFVNFSARTRPDSVFDLAEHLLIPSGPRAGEPLELLDWHSDALAEIESGDAREYAWSCARGNAKSGLAELAILAALLGVGPRWRGHRFITLTSATRDVAGYTFGELSRMIEGSPWEREIKLLPTRLQAFNLQDGSHFECITTARGGIGRSVRLAVIDEVSYIRSPEDILAVARGSVAKTSGALIALGTRSNDPPGGEAMERILDKLARGDAAGAVYSAESGCALDDPAQIARANPALGTTIQLADILSVARDATTPIAESRYRQHHLNQAVRTGDSESWLPPDRIDALRGDAPASGRAQGAIGVGAVDEPTTAAVYWPDSGRLQARIFATRAVRQEAQRAGLPVEAWNTQQDWLEYSAGEIIPEAVAWAQSLGAAAITCQSWRSADVGPLAAVPVTGIGRDDLARAIDATDRRLRDGEIIIVGTGAIPALALSACRLSRGFDGRRNIHGELVPPMTAGALAMAIGREPPPQRQYRPMRSGWIDLETGAIQ